MHKHFAAFNIYVYKTTNQQKLKCVFLKWYIASKKIIIDVMVENRINYHDTPCIFEAPFVVPTPTTAEMGDLLGKLCAVL